MQLDLQSILDMWSIDSAINRMKLSEASSETPMLHAKYLNLLAKAKLSLKKYELEQKTLLKEKWLYYNGKMDQKQIAEKQWEPDPFNGLKVLKGDLDYYYDSDEDIQNTEKKIEYIKTIVGTLTEILDMIKWRHQTIKNIIEWRKFESGG